MKVAVRILLVTNEPAWKEQFEQVLFEQVLSADVPEVEIEVAGSAQGARSALDARPFDIILVRHASSPIDCPGVFKRAQTNGGSDLPVLMLVDLDDYAVEVAPFLKRLPSAIRAALERARLRGGRVPDAPDVPESELELLVRERTENLEEANAALRAEIAERKRTADSLHQSELRYRALVETQTELVVRWEPTGALSFANQACCDFLGVAREELLGRAYERFLARADTVRLAAQVAVCTPDKPSFSSEHWVYPVSGELRWVQWTHLGLFTEQGALKEIQSVGRDATSQKRAEEALVRQSREVRSLSRRLMGLQEEERANLARELHDEVGQALTGLKMLIDRCLSTAQPAALTHLQEAQAIVRDVMQTADSLALDLRPAMLDHHGILPALLWYLDSYSQRTGVRVDFHHTGLGARFPRETETAAYRVVQEALTNVARHAGVEVVSVRLWRAGSALCLQVEDCGKGFEVARGRASAGSLGLAGMSERVEGLGGRFTLESAPGSGTCLMAELPLGAEDRERR